MPQKQQSQAYAASELLTLLAAQTPQAPRSQCWIRQVALIFCHETPACSLKRKIAAGMCKLPQCSSCHHLSDMLGNPALWGIAPWETLDLQCPELPPPAKNIDALTHILLK